MQEDLKTVIINARQGDLIAFSELVERFQNMAIGYAFSLLGDLMLAEDAAQDAFVKVYIELKNLRHPEAFSRWLFRIIKSCCNQIMRKRIKNTCHFDELQDEFEYEKLPETILLKQELAHHLWKAMSCLSEEHRIIFILKHIEGNSYKHIAQALGITENDVTNRLHAARKQLRKEMLSMLEENVREITAMKNNEFKNRVLRGIPKITFHIQKGGCPEDEALVASIRACMEYLGEDYSYLDMIGRWPAIRLDYVLFMGVTGAAFRMLWPKNKWDGGLWDILNASNDISEPIKRAFDAAGYDCEIIWKSDKDDKDLFIQKIVQSIDGRGRPVIARGVVGPPECCILAGYNPKEDTMLGWSLFQNQKKYSADVKKGPNGYFVKKNWYQDTYGIIIIGEKKAAPDIDAIFKDALNYGASLIQTSEAGEFYSGVEAFKAWTGALLDDNNFKGLNKGERYARMETHMTATSLVIEGHWYGSNFLRMAAAHMAQVKDDVLNIAELMHKEHKLMYKCWDVLGGGWTRSQKKADLLVEHEVRAELAKLITEAGEYNRKAAELMKQITVKI